MAGDDDRDRARVLTYPQVRHLQRLLNREMAIPPKGHGPPTLTLSPRRLIESVRDRLSDAGIPVRDIRINGSAASCVVAGGLTLDGDPKRPYNDIDVLFNLCGAGLRDDPTRHDKIRSAALSALVDFFPDDSPRRISTEELSESYAHKMVKIENSIDRWSLISLQNQSGPNIELKFVDVMKRKYQFSIDSFQVIIDSFLLYSVISDTLPLYHEEASIEMNEQFFPTVFVQTFYTNFDDALDHLRHNLIATHNPEEIRGGGLLKYCGLLAFEYKLEEGVNAQMLEKYMCARFFIDFPSIALQRVQLQNYLANHFVGQEAKRGLFLVLAINVIQRSAFCLPAHERDTTLKLIHQMAIEVTFYPELRACSKQQEMNSFDRNVTHLNAFSNVAQPFMAGPNAAPVPQVPCSQCAHNCAQNNRIYTPFYVYPVYFPRAMVIPDTN